jgi:hypothetical protein
LTVAEIGLQKPAFAEPMLGAWKTGKKSHGELRNALEREIWPSYGTGLWDEPWAKFYGNLARAVQPYAHYTEELQGWQFVMVSVEHDSYTAIEMTGLETYDLLKGLGRAGSSSKLLFQRGEWWQQLTPNFWFKPGHDGVDEA